MTKPSAPRLLRALWPIVLLAHLAFPHPAAANGGDLPPEIVLQGFVKPENGRLLLIARVPLVLLSSFSLPKRGPGYLDLARMEDKLQQAALATGRQIELRADGVALAPTVRKARISPLSDRSFANYATALAHVEGPPLPAETDLFWNQGFFDAELEYPLRSPDSHLSVRVSVAPELGARVKLQLVFLPADGSVRSYDLSGGPDWVALDPRWYQAAFTFTKAGFVDAFAVDRFAFLLCLVAPFRRFRSVLAVVMVMTATQAFSLTAVAERVLTELRWLPAVFASILAATIVLLAIGNLAAPSLRRRWFIGALIGALGGFGSGHLLAHLWQFAGRHTLVSVASFNVGLALGEIVSLVLALAALRLLLDLVLGPTLCVVVVSALVAHAGWHWMIEGGHELGHAIDAVTSQSVVTVALWLLPALLVGAMAWLLPRRFDGRPVASLRAALFDRY